MSFFLSFFILYTPSYLRKRLIRQSGLKIYAYDGLDEAAAKAVEAASTGKVNA